MEPPGRGLTSGIAANGPGKPISHAGTNSDQAHITWGFPGRIHAILAMIPPSCRVVRDGALITVPAADLVKGDVVLVVRLFGEDKLGGHTETFPVVALGR